MFKYNVVWQKRYYLTGSIEVEASSQEEAVEIVEESIGDFGLDDGSLSLDDDYEEVHRA